jgi:hypothetical protein
MRSKTRALALNASYSSSDVPKGSKPSRRANPVTRRSACGSGSGRISSAWTALATAVDAPAPSARIETLTSVSTGRARSARLA